MLIQLDFTTSQQQDRALTWEENSRTTRNSCRGKLPPLTDASATSTRGRAQR